MNECVEYLKKLAGNEGLNIVTPQFKRTDGTLPIPAKNTTEFFDWVKTLDHKSLIEIGLRLWDEGHYLYPSEWYDYIPNGYTITDIEGVNGPFMHGVTDDDIRYGMLAYGFKKGGKDE